MIRTFGLKSAYSPITKLADNYYKISWGYEDIKDPIYAELTAEEQAKVDAGEQVERTKIGEADTDYCTYVYETVHFKPSIEYIKSLIIGWYNKQIDDKILSGFVWNNIPVWLSSENQFNYKAAYDLAVQTQGATLPVTFKFGDTFDPVYYTFNSIEEFTTFYMSAISYINTCLAEGWTKKDNINWESYKIN